MEDYKEKLRLAKEALDSGSYDKETIEYIFPELKESEDEKIRKALIHLINEQDGFLTAINGISVKDVIAWLEKQGEQPNKVSLWKHWKDGIAGNGEGKLTYLIKIGNTYNLTSCLGFECDYIELSELDSLTLEKQGEQKPIDKVEQEEDVELTDFESALFSAFSDAWQEYLSGKEVNVAKWAREHSAELLEVAREQKPAWSEEDKVILGEIIDFFENGTVKLQHDLSLYASWLKSLKERMKGE